MRNSKHATTKQTFGDQLRIYTIVDATNDKTVLHFRVGCVRVTTVYAGIDDKDVCDIDWKEAFEAPERIHLAAQYILDHFNRKPYRGDDGEEA